MPDEQSKSGSEASKATVVSLPSIALFRKRYATGGGDTDQRDLRVFKEFESAENFSRLRSELIWLKEGKVAEKVCDQVIGKPRASRYTSYKRWGELMLIWAAQLKK